MRAYDIMAAPVYYVTPKDSIARVRKLFLRYSISSVPVIDDGNPVGMIGEPDIADAFYHAREPVDELPAEKVMSKKILTVGSEDAPESIAGILLKEKTKAALVMEEKPLGIITKTNLLEYFVANYTGKARVGNLMDKNVRTVKPQHSIFHAVRKMQEEGVNRLVVVDDNLLGIISMKDVVFASPKMRPIRRIIEEKPPRAGRDVQILPLTVSEVMRTNVYTISPTADATKAGKLMLEKNIGSLVVVEGSDIKGMFTKTDVARYLANQ